MSILKQLLAICALGIMMIGQAAADDFALEFDWGDIPNCTTGRPNVVLNPVFTLSNVPAETVLVRFKLRDIDAPSYNHGGGRAAYDGESTILPGAFRYKSPCPPSGQHRYRWTAWALNADGKVLAETSSTQWYP